MKINTVSDLNGTYSVIYQSDGPPMPFVWFDHTDAVVELLDGKLTGGDLGGTKWEADVTFIAEEMAVEFTARVIVSAADSGTFVRNERGEATRNTQSYAGKLQVVSVGDNLGMYGVVTHGVVSIKMNFRRR
jgi:hypothetical protein